jgi:hypothetical protein
MATTPRVRKSRCVRSSGASVVAMSTPWVPPPGITIAFLVPLRARVVPWSVPGSAPARTPVRMSGRFAAGGLVTVCWPASRRYAEGQRHRQAPTRSRGLTACTGCARANPRCAPRANWQRSSRPASTPSIAHAPSSGSIRSQATRLKAPPRQHSVPQAQPRESRLEARARKLAPGRRGSRCPVREIQRMRTDRLSAVVAPAALAAVTLHWTLRPRSLRVTPSVRPRASLLRLPFTSQP